MPIHDDVLATLRTWEPPTWEQAALREAYVGLLLARPDACARTCTPGHITASTIVLDATGTRMLLTLHPRIGLWVQLGGHIEPEDGSLLAAALREATEESGIEGLVIDPEPVQLSVHPITCKNSPPTRHFDVRFVAWAPADAVAVRSEESRDLRWFDLDAPPEDFRPDTRELAHWAARRPRP